MTVIDLAPATKNLCALIEAVPDERLASPTPCTEYSVGDLLDHISGLPYAFGGAAVKATGETATMGPRGDASTLGSDWKTSIPGRLRTLEVAWRDPDAWTGMTRVGGQDLPGEVCGIVLLGELVVHGWDLSRASGMRFDVDEATLPPLYGLVRQTFGPGQDAPRGQAFGPGIDVPDNAPVLDRILGMLGRDPAWRSA